MLSPYIGIDNLIYMWLNLDNLQGKGRLQEMS